MKTINILTTGSIITSAFALSALYATTQTSAITPEIPHTLIYEGRLLSKTSQKLEGDYTMRFSLWKTTDIQDGEIDATTGAIDTSDSDYGNWSEEIAITFTDQGYFSAILGEQQVFTDILLANHKYLQVEIRKGVAGDGNDADYQILDVDVLDDEKDRKLISSLPYAFNAEEANTAITSQQSSGSVGNVFVIDPDNSVETAETGEIKLQFGEMLAKIIAYNYDRQLFTISDSVEITGGLSLKSDTGTINFSAENIAGDNTYILPDSDESTTGITDETLTLVDTTTSQNLENKTIDATKNNIINLDTSSLVASAKTETITPQFPNTTFEANTSNNQVSVFMGNETDATTDKTFQYYKISTDTTDNTLHTGKFIITFSLPEFTEFDTDAGSITFLIKTSSSDILKNSFDISVKDFSGNILISQPDITSTTAGDWQEIVIDMSNVTLPSPLEKNSIQLEIDANISTGENIFLSTISAEYKGK